MANRGILITEGVALIILGALAVFLPQVSTLAIELFIGVLLIISGLVQSYRALRWKGQPGFVWTIITSLVALIAGILLLAFPKEGVVTLTLIISIFFFVEGIAKIAIAFRLRPQPHWVWYLTSGCLSVVLAAIIWAGWPESAVWLIGLLVGINLIFYGFALIAFARSLP